MGNVIRKMLMDFWQTLGIIDFMIWKFQSDFPADHDEEFSAAVVEMKASIQKVRELAHELADKETEVSQ